MIWPIRPLGELCDVLDSRRRPITKKDRSAGEFPYYGATGILDYVDDYIFDEDLVLIGEDGAKWGVGDRTSFLACGKYWVNNHAHVVRPREAQLSNNWLIHYLNHSDLTPFVSGLTVPKLNQGSLREIAIPLPAIDEQQRIVAILDEAFAGIATAKANAEKNLQNAKAVFEVAAASAFEQETDDWPQARLGETCQIARGGSPRPIKAFMTDASDGVNWIKISDASASSKYIYETREKIKPSGVARSRLVQGGDFLLSNSMSFGRPYIMRTSGCIHDGWLVLSKYEKTFDQDFLYLLLGSQYIYRQFDRLAAGSTVRNLNIDLARSVIVPMPPLAVQIRIAAELHDLSERVERLSAIYTRKLAALEALKQSLLAKAFSGAL